MLTAERGVRVRERARSKIFPRDENQGMGEQQRFA